MDEGGSEPSPTMVRHSRAAKHAIGGKGGGQLNIEELTWFILFPRNIHAFNLIGWERSVFFRALSIWQMYDNQLAINIYMKTPQGYDGCVLKPHTSPECPTSIRNNIAMYVETGRKRWFWLFGSQGDIIRWHVRGKADISVAHGHSIDQRSQVVLPSWPLLPPAAAGIKALYCFGNMNPALAENKQGAVSGVIL